MAEAIRAGKTIAVRPLGLTLSAFLAISYVLCIVGYLVLPGLPVKHEALSIFLPGFELLSWRTFLIGLAFMYVRLARAEEREALAEFGAAYERYRHEVLGFIPGIGSRSKGSFPDAGRR